MSELVHIVLIHWGSVIHICIGNLTIIVSDNGLSPGQRQAIIWTNAGILLTGTLGTKVNDILIEIHGFLFTKIHLKMSSGKCRPSCVGLNVLNGIWYQHEHIEDWTILFYFILFSFFFFQTQYVKG